MQRSLDRVELWLCQPEMLGDPRTRERCEALLDDDERARNRRFAREADRRLDLATRALVRTTLSRYTAMSPESWRFVRSELGRPEAVGSGAPRFSISHTPGLAACAVSRGLEIGVEVESIDRGRDAASLAARFFSAAEADGIGRLPPDRQSERFLELWTLKEAYAKARGLGLTLPLDTLRIESHPDGPCAASFRGDQEASPSAWRFLSIRIDPGHLGAIAVRCPLRNDVVLAVFRSSLFAPEQPLGETVFAVHPVIETLRLDQGV